MSSTHMLLLCSVHKVDGMEAGECIQRKMGMWLGGRGGQIWFKGDRERNEGGGQRLGLLSILIPHAAVEIHGEVHVSILDIFTN